MRTIAIDARFGGDKVGLGTFTRGLLRALVASPSGIRWVVLVRSMDEAWLRDLQKEASVRLVHAPWRHYSLSEQWHLPRLLSSLQIDAAFFPHFNVPLRCPVPFLAVVHDLILHRFPGNVSWIRRLAYRVVMRHTARSAAWVFAPSQTVLSELQTYDATLLTRSSVLSPGIDASYQPQSEEVVRAVRTRYGLPTQYVLYVGNRRIHKNVQVLIQAHAASHLPDTALVLVAPADPSHDRKLPTSCVVLSDVDAADMPALYSGARGLVTATLAEGFCLPILEAMRCRCPVLCSSIPPLPEVSGGFARLVEPTVSAFADALRTLSLAPPTEDELSAAQAYAETFTWERACRVFLARLTSRFPPQS